MILEFCQNLKVTEKVDVKEGEEEKVEEGEDLYNYDFDLFWMVKMKLKCYLSVYKIKISK